MKESRKQPCEQPAKWAKPALRRLGTIRQVGGAEFAGSQAVTGKKS